MEREDDIMEMEVMEGQTIEIEIEEPETPIPLEWKEGKAWERGRDWLNGKDGKNGLDGKDWNDGRDWRDGIDGTDWKNGENGKDGKNGENGKSAYEIAVENGFVGTLEEWIQSLKWKDGKPGKNGENGRDWRPGDQGPRGIWVIGPAGPSAYQIAVSNGFVGTEAEWLASLWGGGSAQETYETVSKNLKWYPYTLSYSSWILDTIVYNTGTGNITKTFGYSLWVLTTITLSGSTPGGINLVKTLGYTLGVLTSISYS